MYEAPHFSEDRIEVLHELIRNHPFATLVAMGPDGLNANHLPIFLHGDISDNGTLRGHVSRANPLWKEYDPDVEALAIFQGPSAYITPSWYPSKKEHGRVVPTWNYAVVHAYGPLSIFEDAAWLRRQVESLTRHQENERPVPWAVSDAPEAYIERQLNGIVGFELPISRIIGKWKVSQNRPEPDRTGVSRGLAAESGGVASDMATIVAQRGLRP